MAENKRKQRVVTPDEDKSSPAPRAALLALVRLLARQAARECVAASTHDTSPTRINSGETNDEVS